ncbi:MAG: hypothetical protein IH602_11265 [Bryobacteraceae bacterium]|nr:hypothetical protein [Bryobacteraceae bacterium]
MSEEQSKSKSMSSKASGTGTGTVLGVLDAELQALVRDLDLGGVMVPPDHVGATIERLLALAGSSISPDTSWQSKWLWALRKPTRANATGERGLAIRLCHARPELFYEVPAAAGVFDTGGKANKRANVDLAVEVVPGEHYILVELKEKSDNPAFAAAEILRNFVLYLVARRHGPLELIERRPVLQARRIDIQVWAPVEYYEGRDWTGLETTLAEGLSQWAVETRESGRDGGIEVSFSFRVVGQDGKVQPVAGAREPMQ